MNQVVFTFGRFNPPTKGHTQIFDRCQELAGLAKCDYKIITSRTCDKIRNPMHLDVKEDYLWLLYPDHRGQMFSETDIFWACRSLKSRGYEHACLVVGEDRAEKFEKALMPYLNHPDPDKSIGLKSLVFHTLPRAKDAISATEARLAAMAGHYDAFKDLVAGGEEKLIHGMYRDVRKLMGITDGR